MENFCTFALNITILLWTKIISFSRRLERLANRPDVKAAEYALKAQMAQVDVARAAFYPQLTISASAGWTNNVGEIVNPGQMLLSAIGSLVQPLFNKGQNRANLRIAKARQEQALVAFYQALLVAGTEVLTAQQSLLQSLLSLTIDRFDLVQGKINLFKALGGENIRKR